MRISAALIDAWADGAAAKGLLPELVRRLIAATGDLTELAVRGADTNNFPGWDGTVTARTANAWLPADRSRWEMGCAADAAGKARDDFNTRTSQTSSEQARDIAFVFVTPRIWAGKDAWQREAEVSGQWRMVRAYDADDLATWLESAGSVALWFGALLGVRGPGAATVTDAWDTWRKQSKLPISREVFVAGRAAQVDRFAGVIAKRPEIVRICADSSDEAVAFACAQLDALGLGGQSACVTQPQGWSFVDAHPDVRFVVAANAQVAEVRAPREGCCLIVPTHFGDWTRTGTRMRDDANFDADVVLARADAHSFENGLIDMGEEPSDASRLSQSCGRSWSVYRRRHARNPAIAKPAWMTETAAEVLSTTVLVGAWNESQAGDRVCIEAVTDRPYEEIERDLRKLAQVDDPPVLRIGNIWKAKAPLELLYLFGPALTNDQVARFFSMARAVLVKPDPALELEPDKRWMAGVYGRVREESGIVLGAMTDSLIKLRVYAEDNQRRDLMARVDALVNELLADADAERWQSLQGSLRQLAEASPDEFLRSLDASLRRSDAPVRSLFSDQSDELFIGRSSHVHLLWALEILAWSPRYLARVCDLLARLADAPLQSNMSNRPTNSLLSLLRHWWPQTTAAAQDRVDALDRLIRHHESVAWDLMFRTLPDQFSSASENAKPRWRDYDAGAEGPNGWAGADIYLPALGKRVLDIAEGNVERIAQLVDRLDSFEDGYRERLMAMIYGTIVLPDTERQQVRDALRTRLNCQFSFNTKDESAIVEARALRALFDALAPGDLVLRHAWLFTNSWIELPDGKEDDFEQTNSLRATLRTESLAEVFNSQGWPGVERLAGIAGQPWLVGWQIATAAFLERTLVDWTLTYWESSRAANDALLGGLLHGLSVERRMALLHAARQLTTPDLVTRLLLAAPFDQRTWTLVDELPVAARSAYWMQVRPGFVSGGGDELIFVVDRFIEFGRHRAAFNALQHHPERIDSGRLVEILNAISSGADPEGGQLDGWRIAKALAALEADPGFSRRELAVLQYRYFDAFRRGQHPAKVLFAEMSRDPQFFMDILSMASPHEGDQVPAHARNHAWSILHEGRGAPGLGADGQIDRQFFFNWIDGVRQIARERDRSEYADSKIGTWLSKCPTEPGGEWPCVVVRELLEDPASDRIRDGLQIGVQNNRGMHSRSMDAGGSPERGLAATFRNAASGMWGMFPRTAETLEKIAESYEHQAKRHDDDTALWEEGTP